MLQMQILAEKIPLVSVVIPTFNRAEELKRAIDSLRLQTVKNWEAIIIDNNSSDETDTVIGGYQDDRLKLYKIDNEGVIAASRNKGIQISRGKYIAFLDSDDWWVPRKLEISLQYLERGADFIYHDLYYVKKIQQFLFFSKVRSYQVYAPVFSYLLLNGNLIPNSSVVIRRSILEKVGLIQTDKDLIAWEDFDYWLRISKVTDKFKRINKTLGYYWGGGGNTSSFSRTLRNLEKIAERFKMEFEEYSRLNNLYPHWIAIARINIFLKQKNLESAKVEFSSIPFKYYMKIPKFIFKRVVYFYLMICKSMNFS